MSDRAGPGLGLVSLCQMAAVRASRRCSVAAADAGGFASAVAFEIELGFEGLVDGFDDLAERFEGIVALAGSSFRF